MDGVKTGRGYGCSAMPGAGWDDAAYRIARALRHNYEKLHIFIPRECKSAGTLLLIGATSLIISEEFSPLFMLTSTH
jgi:hypothetical protein